MKTIICQHCRKPYSGKTNMTRRKFCGNGCVRAHRKTLQPALFWAKVDKSVASGCWLYMGFRKWDGYGWLARAIGDGPVRYMTAHRYAWILTHGEPPADMEIRHKCHNPPCCNPAHLELGTHLQNMQDSKVSKRHVFGERQPRAKLDYAKVCELRKLRDEGWKYKDLADRYGIASSTAICAYNGKHWKIPHAAGPSLSVRQPRPRRQS